jgi:S-adenosylmethionine-dependent methyltransferase
VQLSAGQHAAASLGAVRGGSGRTGSVLQVLQLLLDALPSVGARGRQVAVLDCGGGSGTFAVPLAQAGAEVTVVDLSADALAILRRRAEEAGVSDAVRAISGDVERLPELVDGGSFELVLAHGILQAVDAPQTVFAQLVAALRPGGLLSLLVDNPAAAVIARALVGELDLALVELRELDVARPRADPETVEQMCAAHGLAIASRHGVGVFSDLVPGSAVDTPAARETLARLDFEAAGREPFASLAAHMHVLARRPET